MLLVPNQNRLRIHKITATFIYDENAPTGSQGHRLWQIHNNKSTDIEAGVLTPFEQYRRASHAYEIDRALVDGGQTLDHYLKRESLGVGVDTIKLSRKAVAELIGVPKNAVSAERLKQAPEGSPYSCHRGGIRLGLFAPGSLSGLRINNRPVNGHADPLHSPCPPTVLSSGPNVVGYLTFNEGAPGFEPQAEEYLCGVSG